MEARFSSGFLLAAVPGMIPAKAIDELVAKVRGLDMDELRREAVEQVLGNVPLDQRCRCREERATNSGPATASGPLAWRIS